MAIATGIAKQLRYKKETTFGTLAGATGAQILRRTQSTLDLSKDTYQSNEMRSDYMEADYRHGVRSVAGNIGGELSAGTYKDFFAAVVRNAWQTAATTGSQSLSVTATGFARAAGSFITDGFKVGNVVRATGFSNNTFNNRNFLITALTATAMDGAFLDGTATSTLAAAAGVTITLAGKTTYVPTSGHTDDSFTFEHWFNDIAQSERFTGCKIGQLDVGLPATGMATIGMQVMGRDMSTGTAQYFTTPTSETTTGILAAVNGAVYVNGVAVALLTGMNFSINGNMTTDPVVGSNVHPDIFEGRVLVSGQLTAFFQDATLRDMFVNETEATIIAAFTASNSANADFLGFTMTRVKIGGASKDDGEKGIIQTLPFRALRDTSGATNVVPTSIVIQDSQA